MPIPQVTDRIKEAPAVALRAVFAGVGQLLMVVDKIRAQMQEQAKSTAPGGEKGPGAAPPSRRPADKTGNVAVVDGRPAPAAARPAAAHADATGARPAPAAQAAPIPGYDGLPIASLRARLRGLDAAGVQALLDYEKANAHRDDVITMFERRLSKIEDGAG